MKSSLKKRIRVLREPFGTAGLILAMVALVAALGGGAYAASGALTGKQKKEVEKIAKKYAGKPGATGVAGPAGAKGDAGAPGAAGAAGKEGSQGVPGKEGEEGQQGEQGEKGEKGEKGETGFASTLPAGATETGAWMSPYFHGHYTAETEFPLVSVSLPFPLSDGQTVKVEYVPVVREAVTTTCPGTAAAPEAAEGWLCIYRGSNGLNTSEAKLTLQSPATSPDGSRNELSVNSPETGVSTTTVARTGFAFAMLETAAGAGKATFASGTWALTTTKAN